MLSLLCCVPRGLGLLILPVHVTLVYPALIIPRSRALLGSLFLVILHVGSRVPAHTRPTDRQTDGQTDRRTGG